MWNNFNNTMQTDGGFMDDSQIAQTEDKSASKRAQNVVPLMIAHILRNTDDIHVWGVPVSIVTIVGIVKQVEQATTKITYELEDETGSIKCLKWMEAESAATEIPVKKDMYARVFGFPRNQNNLRHMFVARIMPITTLAEITTHLLEVTHNMLQAEKVANNIISNDSMKMQTSDISMSTTDFMNDDNRGMSKEQELVLNIIKLQSDSVTGIERDVIKSKVPTHMKNQVDQIIDFLSSEGHIYTTMTDDHFSAT